MKKLFLLSILITTFSYSQVTDENGTMADGSGNTDLSGNIGIGITPAANSPFKFEVNGSIKGKQGWFINTLPNGHVFPNNDWGEGTALIRAGVDSTGGDLFGFYDVPQSNLNSKPFVWFHIEDRNDKARFRLHAYEGGATSFKIFGKEQNDVFQIYDPGDQYTFASLDKPDSYFVIGGVNVWPVEHKLIVKQGSALIEGNILTNSNIGIGTTSFIDGSDTYRLSVEGKVRAHEVKVYTTWADFVFAKNYNLPTLKEVESYIKENGHLKDIPSAEEVKENGVKLGEMNKLLLQKIEELTLYVIDLKKEIEVLKTKK
ncbi:hypothetical protein [Flavivirga sp. 57AJ16]|uniref:hypothetical protein n=1 Tax=Flavivirga sp. 57AJ16 TaxID=3025307 RepID=UPI0023655B8B|nr:hypothetical protein [Flavivirga sp. 57AJ16]MDD7885333.1 hypothetical protein [Flavivirga sp. 57AJ16]